MVLTCPTTAPGTRPEVAAALGDSARLRGDGRPVAPEVLLPRDVRVSVRARARRPRPQLHHRRRHGAHQADARLQRPAPVRLGRLRPAGRERRHQERHPSRSLDARQHRAHEGAAAAARHQLRLGARAGHLRSPSTTSGTSGSSSACSRRAWRTGASRRSTGARADNTVLANEQVVDGGCWRCGTPVETRDLEQWFFRITAYADELLDATAALTAVAREGPDDAAQLDRAVGGRARAGFRCRGRSGDGDRGLHHPHRHDLRRDVRAARARAPAGGSARRALGRPGARCGSRRRRSGRRIARRASAARSRSRASTPGVAPSTRSPDEPVPIWVANFVLGDYGTGAIMAVPAHDQRDFEFAREVQPADPRWSSRRTAGRRRRRADRGTRQRTARCVDSGEFSGLSVGGRAEADDRRREGSAASAKARCSTA